MRFAWTYFTLSPTKLGLQLHDEEGTLCFPDMEFVDVAEAERWLEENDIRGNVRQREIFTKIQEVL